MKGLRNGASIFLSTGYCVGTVMAILLNTILPEDGVVSYDSEKDASETATKVPPEQNFKDDIEEEMEA
eukprot:CAMPEP_0197241868 /NCGR_PEP_ID=MMETSP1429-20130617/7781_1 /TAXON_ID=49237 /ORGANISM="Chaetoceros  sp., Strain UNC1202" /LENGTH=67 /DNA_ID=CAMNT_0042701779 /DNA_START=125 /DNA_END=328 /DNA_ORIENTATION=+